MIEGDARDVGAPIRALDGCDAVVSSLGTGVGFREVSLLTIAARALVTAMTRRGVRVWSAIAPEGSRSGLRAPAAEDVLAFGEGGHLDSQIRCITCFSLLDAHVDVIERPVVRRTVVHDQRVL